MQLSKQNLNKISTTPGLIIPDEKIFSLPEKVLQFGTGVLLRGLPDYFIDKANRHGIFNGRIVAVKSTTLGPDAFDKQDCLYTLCIRGFENGKTIEENIITSSISRVLSAKKNWEEILNCAANPEMEIVISNTTEVGIALTPDNVHASPPESFPGKLLAFLYKRFKIFNGDREKGMVIIPTELIPDNGDTLLSIVLELAHQNGLEPEFLDWIENHNYFCNSLVDRIVPGKLPFHKQKEMVSKFGYEDELMIMAESSRLWAIESNQEKVKSILSFEQADEGMIIADDIERFRELKLRLLNGTHTFSCALAHLAGFGTVREAMTNPHMASFIHNLAINEIADAVSDKNISYHDACEFAKKVFDRFCNPFIDHQWLSISMQYTSKMKMRNVPLLIKYFNKHSCIAEHMAMGFAAYLLFMKCSKNGKSKYIGNANGTAYEVQDDHAEYFEEKWKDNDPENWVETVIKDKELWGEYLSKVKGFDEAVKKHLKQLMKNGVMTSLRRIEMKKTFV